MYYVLTQHLVPMSLLSVNYQHSNVYVSTQTYICNTNKSPVRFMIWVPAVKIAFATAEQRTSKMPFQAVEDPI